MIRFTVRHITTIAIVAVLGWWALFYVPGTPSYALLKLKLAVDGRDGAAAVNYVDFREVARNAGYEYMKHEKAGGSVLGQIVGESAVAALSGPIGALARAWAQRQVNDGARDVQIPGLALTGAILMMRRDGRTAHTRFRDKRGRMWDIRLEQQQDGCWRIVEVKGIRQLLANLGPAGSQLPTAPNSR